MIGNIIAPEDVKPGTKSIIYFEEYFDPITHTATEAKFLEFLRKEATYTDKIAGYKVILSNSNTYDGGVWIIADANHDSANTDQFNCYDLISLNCINPDSIFGADSNYRSSNDRAWINDVLYPGFSDNIKARMMNPRYNLQGTWYDDDKLVEPSGTELGGVDADKMQIEGLKYPIFPDGNLSDTSRAKLKFDNTTTEYWWTRSKYGNSTVSAWCVNTIGGLGYVNCTNGAAWVAPIMRIG